MVFICIYLGLIQSLKLEGGNASFTSHTKQFKTVCGANSPDSRLSSLAQKNEKVAAITNRSKNNDSKK